MRRYTWRCIAAKFFVQRCNKILNLTVSYLERLIMTPGKVTMTADEFKTRYMAYHKRLYRLAYVMTSDPHDAEDLLQDLYLKMWQLRDRINSISNPEAFMATVMRRMFYDRVRAKAGEISTTSLAEARDVTASNGVDEQLERQEEWTEFEAFISELPPKEQKVIRMHILEDRDYREIGSLTGLAQGSIRALVMRAKNKIKQRFKL